MKVSMEYVALVMTTEKDRWELRRIVLDHEGTQVNVYSCLKNKTLQWVESTEGLAYSKFMNIIPNEIVNVKRR